MRAFSTLWLVSSLTLVSMNYYIIYYWHALLFDFRMLIPLEHLWQRGRGSGSERKCQVSEIRSSQLEHGRTERNHY